MPPARHRNRYLHCLATLAALCAGPLDAATVAACGPNICYEYDDTQAAIALTGTPTLVGDDMEFLPPAFIAHSTGGAGWDIAAANFIFSRVYTVNPLNEIATFHTFEEFDYEIITDGEVRATLYAQARSNLLASDSTSTLVNWGPVTGDTGGAQIDDISAYLFPAAAFTAAASDMRVTIQNVLRAYADAPAEDAFIQKKFSLTAITTQPAPVVPIPAAAWLFVSALSLLGAARRLAAGTGVSRGAA
jgi:hypothetical protein